MKRIFVFFFGGFAAAASFAQTPYPVYGDNTAVPFLRIAPDARAAGMGDAGVASANDANAIHWNLARLPFSEHKISLAISYTPWMRALVPDMNHSYISMSYRRDSVSAIAGSLRYFSLGNITSAGISGTPTQFRPNEFAFDIGYTRKLTSQIAAGITARFIQSNPSGLNGIIVRDGGGRACAGDISFAWQGNAVNRSQKPGRYWQPCAGFVITNLGTKMWYQDRDSAEFLPTNARLGVAVVVRRSMHQFTLQGEVNRLIVPMPHDLSNEKTLRPVVIGGGAEYSFAGTFKLRGGYSHDFFRYYNLQYLTTGIGIEYNVFRLDFSYLFPINSMRSPLEKTLRFSLLFSFDAVKRKTRR